MKAKAKAKARTTLSLTPAARSWGLEDRRLYLCSPDRGDLERFVEACIGGGVDVVQLREKHLAGDRLAEPGAGWSSGCAPTTTSLSS